MPLFTRENAREMARKGNELRWSRWREEKSRTALAEGSPPEAASVAENLPESREDENRQRALARVLKQLQDVDKLIDEAQDAKAWDMLTRAKERLAKVWFHLGGIAGPGQLKPQAQPKAKRAYTQIPQGWQPPPPAAPPSEFS